MDAYLTPAIKRYLEGFASGFKDDLKGVNVLFMQSDGGLTPMDCFNGSRAILSGPAGETDFTYLLLLLIHIQRYTVLAPLLAALD